MDECLAAISSFPVVDVGVKVKAPDGTVVQSVVSGAEYVVEIDLRRVSPYKGPHAFAPLFGKPIDESWIIILGNVHERFASPILPINSDSNL